MAPIFHRSIPAQPRSFKSTASTVCACVHGKIGGCDDVGVCSYVACYMVTFVVMTCCTDSRGCILNFFFHTDTFTAASSNS